MTKRPALIATQASKPSGLLGRLISIIMAMETSRENATTLDLLELQQDDRLLEIGFGHGKTIKRAASLYIGAFIAGIDQSDLMVNMASRQNRNLIKAGRVELRLGDATSIPFTKGFFNKVFSVHTIYFWSKPQEQFKEIHRVLKVNGRFVLCFRYDNKALEAFPQSVYKFRTAEDICNMLQDCDFRNIRVETKEYASRTLFWIVACKKRKAPGLDS